MAGGRNGTTATTDLALAAYYLLHGLRLLGLEDQRGRRGGVAFRFDDPHGLVGQLRLDFANSPEQRYDAQLRSLRKQIQERKRGGCAKG